MERSGVPEPALDAVGVGHDWCCPCPGGAGLAASSSDSVCWSVDFACLVSLSGDGVVEVVGGVLGECSAEPETDRELRLARRAEALVEVVGGLVLVEASGGGIPRP